jgi:hypothetical protein
MLQLAQIDAATNCSTMQRVETNLYARSYARSSSDLATRWIAEIACTKIRVRPDPPRDAQGDPVAQLT